MRHCPQDDCEWSTVTRGIPGQRSLENHLTEAHIEEVDADIPDGMVQVKLRGEWTNVTKETAHDVARNGGDVSDEWLRDRLNGHHHTGYTMDRIGDASRKRDEIEYEALLEHVTGYIHDPKRCEHCEVESELLESMDYDGDDG